MAISPKCLFRAAGPLLLLTMAAGCSDPPKPAPLDFNHLPVGRYTILQAAGSHETIELDTGSGKTWRLSMASPADGGGVIGWEPIKDLP